MCISVHVFDHSFTSMTTHAVNFFLQEYNTGLYDICFSQTNTFQLVLAMNGNCSFALFLYLDDGIQWTTGDDGGGSNGLGGDEAQVGYDAGDYINYYTVPGSMTPDIVDIETTSNIDIPGMYIFQVGSNSTGKPSYTYCNTCLS